MFNPCEIMKFVEKNFSVIARNDWGKEDNIHCKYCNKVIYAGGLELDFCCESRKTDLDNRAMRSEMEAKKQNDIEKADQTSIYVQSISNSGFEGFEKIATFKNFKPVDVKTSNALNTCKEYTDSTKANLILAGSVGVGKTHLACATAKYIGYHKKKTFGILRCSSLETTDCEKYKVFDVLVIDDIGREIGSESKTKSRIGIISEVIEHRYRNEMKTIYTTNFSVAELVAKFGSHVVDRICANSMIPERIEVQSYRS